MSIQPGQVTQLAETLRSRSGDLNQILNDLDSQVKKLESAWQGDAQDAYKIAQAKWNTSLQRINGILNNVATTTEEISSNYTSTDSGAAKLFS
ncbi:MAG: WXG100 family type VII secretion target [Bifidobacteriaceae bacterium]|jgi:early secretory antigenic target protein ESAT-6|nr:WXG100 family type VII secretion target [Bifidobacteriaceae bacterium]